MMHEILVIILTLLSIVGALLVVLITLIFVILIIPYRVELTATKNSKTRVQSRLKVANIGVYTFQIWPAREKRRTRKKDEKRRRRRETRETGRPSRSSQIMARLSVALVPECLKLLTRLWRSLRPRVMAAGRFGAEDPSVTGMLYGAYQAVIRPLNIAGTLQPCFDRACLEGRVEVSARIWPIEIIVDAARFMLAKPVRQVWFPELRNLASRR